MDQKINLTHYEQEPVINFNNEGKRASLYTCDPVMLKHMGKLEKDFPDIFIVEESRTCSPEQIRQYAECDLPFND